MQNGSVGASFRTAQITMMLLDFLFNFAAVKFCKGASKLDETGSEYGSLTIGTKRNRWAVCAMPPGKPSLLK